MGYLLGAIVMAGFAASAVPSLTSRGYFLVLFALAGGYLAVEEALEGVMTADLVPDRSLRGTAYGVMGAVNGLGDFFSSLLVGMLMYYRGIRPAFMSAAAIMLAGTVLLAVVGRKKEP